MVDINHKSKVVYHMMDMCAIGVKSPAISYLIVLQIMIKIMMLGNLVVYLKKKLEKLL